MMRRGQVALYLLMTIVALAIVAFMNVDIFLAVRAKNRVQNAGDAAALAAARVQGELLNEIARLNIAHIQAAIRYKDDEEACRAACDRILNDQRRCALLGPVRGWNGIESALKVANEAAKSNYAERQESFEKILQDHVATIRTVYSGGADSDGDPYPEPWPGAWVEYAAAIESAISGGLFFGPDNNEYYDAQGGHLLLNQDFYSAIQASSWCWFRFHAENVLKNYGGWSSWGPLPSRKTNSEANSEIFSLHVEARTGALTDVFSFEEIAAMAARWGGRAVSLEDVRKATELANGSAVWFYLEPNAWSQWFDGLRLAGCENDENGDFPITGEVKREYNVRGCTTVCRCILTAPGIMDKADSSVQWSAAAKPFGKIADGAFGDQPVTANRYFALPVFETVRLIPLDAATGASLSTADYEWVLHVRKHLPVYLQSGPQRNNGCLYCLRLCEWENASFRQTGIKWLELHAGTCVRSTSGRGRQGGTRHGH